MKKNQEKIEREKEEALRREAEEAARRKREEEEASSWMTGGDGEKKDRFKFEKKEGEKVDETEISGKLNY